jgi:hypothetical protein
MSDPAGLKVKPKSQEIGLKPSPASAAPCSCIDDTPRRIALQDRALDRRRPRVRCRAVADPHRPREPAHVGLGLLCVAAPVPAISSLAAKARPGVEAEGDKEELKEDGSGESLLAVHCTRSLVRSFVRQRARVVCRARATRCVAVTCVAPFCNYHVLEGRRVVPPVLCRFMEEPWREPPRQPFSQPAECGTRSPRSSSGRLPRIVADLQATSVSKCSRRSACDSYSEYALFGIKILRSTVAQKRRQSHGETSSSTTGRRIR